jgi:sulfotransferase 6B1
MRYLSFLNKKIRTVIRGDNDSQMKYPIFLNSLPKSGTHLLAKALTGFPGIEHSGSHLERKQVAKFVDKGVDFPVEGREDLHIPNDCKWIERLLQSIKPGRFITSHMFYNVPIHDLLGKMSFKIILAVRDPRDVVVSWADFMVKEKTHLLFPFFRDTDFDFRIVCGIQGIGGEETGTRRQPPISELIMRHLKWETEAGAFLVRFEDLIGEQGGGSREIQSQLLKDLAAYLEIDGSDQLIHSICESLFGGTNTFNKGVIGRWRENFTPKHKALFKENAGHLLIQMGYESDFDW